MICRSRNLITAMESMASTVTMITEATIMAMAKANTVTTITLMAKKSTPGT